MVESLQPNFGDENWSLLEAVEDDDLPLQTTINDFFAAQSQANYPENLAKEIATTQLFLDLKHDADQTAHSLMTNVTAESFATGSRYSAQMTSLLGTLIGNCGPLCLHSFESMARTGSKLTAPNLTPKGSLARGLSQDKNGNLHLETNATQLASLTGLSEADIAAGHYSADQIFRTIYQVLTEELSQVCGLGLVQNWLNVIIDGLIPVKLAA